MERHAADDPRDARIRRLALVLRQAAYLLADGLGKEYDLERPCKRCEERRKTDHQSDLALAYRAVVKLVMPEYPEGRTLAAIAATWGEGISDDEIAALRRVEGALAP